ncbi:MAG: LacI family DNA-binding transcriptional regulator [Bacteroidota bacterium]
MKKVSIDDVAKSLGVSKTLVSLVINNKSEQYGISEETKQRVLKKIVEMNFQPNRAARGLRTGKSNVIGVIVSDISNPFYSRIARVIEDNARKAGYHIMLCSSDEDVDKELELINILKNSQQVDGLIISSSQNSPAQLSPLAKSEFPTVFIDRSIDKLKCVSVGVDNKQGSADAVNQLIKNGLKKIAIFTISPSYISTIHDRLEGYKQALRDNQIKFDKNLVREIPFSDIKNSVKRELKSLLSTSSGIDGLFVVNNHIALACLESFSELDIRIPHALAFVSFDDIDVFKFYSPSITAVAQPVDEIGEVAFAELLSLINKNRPEDKPLKIELPTTLMIRKSCGTYLNSKITA